MAPSFIHPLKKKKKNNAKRHAVQYMAVYVIRTEE